MKQQRIPIDRLDYHESEEHAVIIYGRLVQFSPATLSIEDQTDRRSFSFPNDNPDLSRARVGDVVEASLRWTNGSWRVESLMVLVPCMLTGNAQRLWMDRWFKHANKKRKKILARARLDSAIRGFFAARDFLEVHTPSLVACPGMEPNLTAFHTSWNGPDRAWSQERFLPTSPEFHMKKLLTLGYEKIFELARTYRNNEVGQLHQPEFTMLEWYRAYEDYETIMADTEELVAKSARAICDDMIIEYQGKKIDLSTPWPRIAVRDLFIDHFNIDFNDVQGNTTLAAIARQKGYDYISEDDSFDDTFFKLFLTDIERELGWDKPVILTDYPIEMAALSRRKPGAGRYCERFEVYIAGVELANAFGELNNAREQRRRFIGFAKESDSARGFHYEPDAEFLESLEFGMPPAAGIALGVDRLLMLLTNCTSLDDVTAFAHRHPNNDTEND